MIVRQTADLFATSDLRPDRSRMKASVFFHQLPLYLPEWGHLQERQYPHTLSEMVTIDH